MIAYHYTTGANFESIVATGVLWPATVGVPVGEKPVLWFSAHPDFEPTATKMILEGGAIRGLSVQETYELCGGLIRFGIDTENLIHWNKLPTAARMKPKTRISLEKEGRRQGADPQQWYGSFGDMPLEHISVIEVMDSDGRWLAIRHQNEEKSGVLKPSEQFVEESK